MGLTAASTRTDGLPRFRVLFYSLYCRPYFLKKLEA